jgi:hypothetical protein
VCKQGLLARDSTVSQVEECVFGYIAGHTSVLGGDFRRTVSRARIFSSGIPAFGASCAELQIAEIRANTSKFRADHIFVLSLGQMAAS